jgi:hypothetical protein
MITNQQSQTQNAVCRFLRCKEMFIDTGEPFDIRNTGSGLYWCAHTQTVIGPDGQVAEPDNCVAGRSCHQGC